MESEIHKRLEDLMRKFGLFIHFLVTLFSFFALKL